MKLRFLRVRPYNIEGFLGNIFDIILGHFWGQFFSFLISLNDLSDVQQVHEGKFGWP